MSLRFRPPGRKASTPFPGAWPTTPVHENSSETSMNHAECNEASGKTKRIVKQTSRSENVDPPHLDHVVSFHKRISQSYAVFTRPRHPSNTAASATGFTNKQSPPTSPVLSEASTIPSEGIHTPEDYPMSFPPDPSLLSHKNSDNFNQLPHRPPRNPSRTFSLRRPTPDDITERRLSAIQLDSPLLNLSPNLHSFNTPSPEFAYSQMSTNPYFISVHDREIPGSDADLPEAPSYSSSLSSLAFAETIRNHSTTIPEFTITPPTGGELTEHNVLATSNSGSSIGIGTDSPVLPSEDGLSPVSAFRGRRYHSPGSHHLSPSSADMDAFGIAASNHTFSDSDSILSIPTSFQSASAQGSISADDTARGHATRQSSVSLSLSLDLSSNGPEGSSTGVQAYGDRAPPFCPPQHPDTRMRSGTIKGEVTVVASDEKPKKSFGKAARLLSIHKVKQLGTRIKKLFKGKPEPDDPGETVYGVTTTTNTVEYTSEHPIPRKRSASRKFGAPSSPPKSRTSPLLMFSKRRSMPAGAVSMPDVSQPRPLRPTSFLAMDGRNLSSSRHLVAMPSITGFLPRADEQPKKGQHRHSGYQQLIRPISKIRIDTTVSPVRRRIRTQTAPANHNDNSSTDPRRFSVASSIGEVIRATVAPHPFLPNKPTHPGTFGLAHRRSASTSARDAWNAAKRVPERDLESPIDPIDVSIPNSPQENIQEPVLQLPLEEAIHSDEEDVLSPVETPTRVEREVDDGP
ncbi:hypothetical protein QCA50_001784 [Cerrena zonata]|uniref:Uncharacterized protein n=1 Tax=Cerrena zonata TaxID=2478898 RepID=A0AAW0GMP3_9APHY